MCNKSCGLDCSLCRPSKFTDLSQANDGDRVWTSHLGWCTLESFFDIQYPWKLIPHNLTLNFSQVKAVDCIDNQGRLVNNGPCVVFWQDISIAAPPRPKPMVKKWLWAYWSYNRRRIEQTAYPLSEELARMRWDDRVRSALVGKIPDTEITEEED